MLQDKSSENFERWTKEDYLKLARKNPIHYMLKSHEEWFFKKDNYELALQDKLLAWLDNPVVIKHMKDAIDYRTMDYYRKKFKSGCWALLEQDVTFYE